MAVKKRVLNKTDLRRMNLPEQYWTAKIGGVQQAAKKPVESLLSKVEKALDEGISIVIHGGPGIGKSSIASILAKEARSLGFTGYFTSFWELRENIREGDQFDETDSVLSRARSVNMLVLDNLRTEDTTDKFYLSLQAIEDIITYRRSKKLVTIITTRLSPTGDFPPSIKDALAGSVYLTFKGVDLRANRSKELTDEFLGKK
jgi:DNA replication protein DnaC